MSAFYKDNGEMVRTATYIRWHVTMNCNYDCPYCDQPHSGAAMLRARDIRTIADFRKYLLYRGRNSWHMFDNFPPVKWLESLDLIPGPISVTLTGGEPFLDYRNFSPFLSEMTAMDSVACVRIDTNGCWNPRNYQDVNWSKVFLNHSFHPVMITLDKFITLLLVKQDAGIQIGMVNYVMDPRQVSDYEHVRETFSKIGVTVNANVYFGPETQSEEGMSLYSKYVPKLDVDLKTETWSPKGHRCYYPAVAYEIDPGGFIRIGCQPDTQKDFIAGEIPATVNHSIPCPYETCGCLDKYAFLAESGRTNRLNLLQEYVDICEALV